MNRHISFPKSENPVRIGIKKHGNSHAYFNSLKARIVATGSLTAIEWDWYRARQKEWEPEVLEAEMKEADRRIAIDYARKLSVSDLREIVAEKQHDE